jgi:hypothetical protein
MFASRRQGTVIAKGLKIVGSVTAEGLVEVVRLTANYTALRSLSPGGLMLPELLQPSVWSWTGKSRVRSKDETLF